MDGLVNVVETPAQFPLGFGPVAAKGRRHHPALAANVGAKQVANFPNRA